MPDGSTIGRFGSGREVRRIEDAGLLAGAGRFTDDFSLPGQTYLSFLRSPHAHARIVSIDATAAASMPGVVAVLTGADLVAAGVKPLPVAPMFQRPDGSPGATPLRPALADGVVRFVGEAVVALIAETAEQAKDALEAVVVEYEDLPVVTELTEAAAEGAPLVWPAATGNIAAQMKHGDAAACDAAFAGAAHVVTLDLVNQRLVPSSMEPRCALSSYDAATGRITLRLSSQMPSGARDTLCEVLNLPAEKVRVVVGDVGGGFGMKTGLYPEDIVVAYAARQIGRPVKWTPTRLDEFLSSTHGRDVESHAELALDADGKVLGYRIRTLANMGAYGSTVGIIIQLMIGPWVSTSIYDIRTIDFDLRAILTHTAPTAAYRGAGRPEAIYLIERLFDAAAHKLGMDPAEIRRRNLIAPEQMPYTNAMGQVYDSGNFGSILEQALAACQMGRLCRPGGGVEGARDAARARTGVVPRMDRRQRIRGAGHRRSVRRRRDRGLCLDDGDGAGDRDVLRAACRRCVRRRDRAHPYRHGRHRPWVGVRQCWLSVAVHRRVGDQSRLGNGGGEWARSGRGGAGGVRCRHRVCRGNVPDRRDRSSHRAVRAGRPPAGPAYLCRCHQLGERTKLAERGAYHARSRSIRRPGR